MKHANDRKQPEATSHVPRRRFRLVKLEDRIAPKRGGKGTNNGCGGGGSTTEYTGACAGSY